MQERENTARPGRLAAAGRWARQHKRGVLLAVLLAALAAGAGCWLLARSRRAGGEALQYSFVRTTTLTRGTLDETVSAAGLVESANTSTVTYAAGAGASAKVRTLAVAVGASLTGTITESMSGFGVSNISVMLTQKQSDDEAAGGVRVRMFRDSTPAAADRITDEMLADYRAAFPEQVACIELTQSVGTGTVGSGEGAVSVNVLGVNDDYFTGEGLQAVSGRAIRNERDAGRKVCFVSDRFVSDALGLSGAAAVGRAVRITVGGRPYTFYIAGVYAYEEDGLTLSFGSDTVVTDLYIPLDVAKTMTGAAEEYQSFTVVCTGQTDAAAFLETTQAYFAAYYARSDSWTVEASSLESLISSVTGMIDTVSLGIAAIAAISLLVGGIGVMNIMLVSITERTREIGTRKALGAPRRAIRLQFIVEAVVICLVGGGIGILAGVALGAAACSLLGYAARPDPAAILLAVGFSMGIGVFFGYYPANRAAGLDPIEALRYE